MPTFIVHRSSSTADDPDTAYDTDAGDDDVDHRSDNETDDIDTPAQEPPSPAPSNNDSKDKRRSLPPGYLGLLRLDLEALQRGHVQGEEVCEIAGLGPVPVSIARCLLGDAVLKLVLTRGKDVANVTHLGRGPTVAQKVAMLWGSPGCVITGCARMAGIEHDHRVDWAQTHHTRVDELDRLCDYHHDLKTCRRWALVTGADEVTEMVPPTDPRHPGQPTNQTRAGPEPTPRPHHDADPPAGPDPPDHAEARLLTG